MLDQLENFNHWKLIYVFLLLTMIVVGKLPKSALGEYQQVTLMTLLFALILTILSIS